jgi:hypothetical protein
MGKTYTGVGYLTGRKLSFHSAPPWVRVDDDTKNTALIRNYILP